MTPLIVVCTHHKTGTVWMGNVFRAVRKQYKRKLFAGKQDDLPPDADIFLQDHSKVDLDALRSRGRPVRCVHVIRDPRDVVMSCFMQSLTLTPVSSAYLTLAGTVNQYANVMDFWRAMLPRLAELGMYVRYEQMVADLPTVARSVLSFLGLGFEDNVLKFYEHARTKRVNSPSYADARKPLYGTAIGRWRNYEKYLEPYMSGLEPFLKTFNYQ